jgi:hypothetical protein
VSEADSKQSSDESNRPAYGEGPKQLGPDWLVRMVPMLWFIIPYTLVWHTLSKWLPFYQAVGIGCFVGQLVAFRARQGRLRRYGVGKYLAFSLLLSGVLSMLALALDVLLSRLFR